MDNLLVFLQAAVELKRQSMSGEINSKGDFNTQRMPQTSTANQRVPQSGNYNQSHNQNAQHGLPHRY